jgi:hypothetical protein
MGNGRKKNYVSFGREINSELYLMLFAKKEISFARLDVKWRKVLRN